MQMVFPKERPAGILEIRGQSKYRWFVVTSFISWDRDTHLLTLITIPRPLPGPL